MDDQQQFEICYRDVKGNLDQFKTVADVRSFLRSDDSHAPEALWKRLCDAICFPEVILKWGQVPEPGKTCCPELIVKPSKFYLGIEPILHLQPAHRLKAGFLPGEYPDAVTPLRRPRVRESDAPSVLRVAMRELQHNGQFAWIARIPFNVPLETSAIEGEHLFQVWVDFPDLWDEAVRFFELPFCVEVLAAKSNQPRTLTIRGGTKQYYGDLRQFDHVIMEGEGLQDVRQMLPELLGTNDPKAETGYYRLTLTEDRRVRPLPYVRCQFRHEELPHQEKGMLGFRDPDRRLYFYAKNKLSFGRSEDSDVLTRLTPLPLPDEDCPIRKLNRDASGQISRTHCLLNFGANGLRLANGGNIEKNLPASTFVNRQRIVGFDEFAFPPDRRTFQIELGGGPNGNLPKFEMKGSIVGSWDDTNSGPGGIPTAEDLLLICGRERSAWKWSLSHRIDAIVITHGKPQRQAEASHVMLTRQIFLNRRGEVVVDPNHQNNSLAVRLIHAGNWFFVQPVVSSDILRLTIDDKEITRFDVSPLKSGMTLQFNFKQGPSLTADWIDPVFVKR